MYNTLVRMIKLKARNPISTAYTFFAMLFRTNNAQALSSLK